MKTAPILTGLLILCFSAAARANEGHRPQGLFEQGNKAYAESRFEDAKECYEELIGQNQGGFELYYNLGNAYYRSGKIGKARLWYERARLEKQADDDVQHNLSFLASRIESGRENMSLGERLTPHRSAFRWIFLGANVLFFLFLGWGLYREAEWIWWARWLSGISFILASILLLILKSQGDLTYGIVLEPRAEVRAGPGPEHRVAFVVPEGQKVLILEASEGWALIGLPEKGLKGWTAETAVEAIPFTSPEREAS
ncbi:MAG: tetratricopeptide repeat protein [Elusimicrobia bacterium]|nr:tetratricopeptide repeat protein [Elusimicrobiota bacterium]